MTFITAMLAGLTLVFAMLAWFFCLCTHALEHDLDAANEAAKKTRENFAKYAEKPDGKRRAAEADADRLLGLYQAMRTENEALQAAVEKLTRKRNTDGTFA